MPQEGDTKTWLETPYGEPIPLQGICSIGRAESNNVIVSKGSVSRHHAVIHERDREYWILDLGGVTFLDSSGLGQLVGSYATAVSHGSEIKLLNLNKRVYDLMQITKLYTVFAIYTDESTAIESFEVAA